MAGSLMSPDEVGHGHGFSLERFPHRYKVPLKRITAVLPWLSE